MPDPSNNDQAKREVKALDLSELQNLSFGPNWSERKESHSGGARGFGGTTRGAGGERRRDGDRAGRDRRPSSRGEGAEGAPRFQGGDGQRRERTGGGQRFGGERRPQSAEGATAQGGERPRGNFRSGDRPRGERSAHGERFRGGERGAHPHQLPFEPVVEALFYPEDTPFKALSHAMRSSCRTYELFEIARLILDKADRHVIVIKPKANGKGVEQIFLSVPDAVPFESEEAAVAHVLKNHLDRFFEVETISCEPPKGSFPVVNRCGMTGALLGPPNYHRYQALLLEHHANALGSVPFEKFQARIESIRDEAQVAQWLEQMSSRTQYKLREVREGEPEVLESLEAVKLFLQAKRAGEIVRKVAQARVAGTAVEAMPEGVIRRSLLSAIAYQKRFPLETANNLRGRLRRLKFTIYKRKGVSFVCAVKRNFRDEGSRFSESVQALVAFIEANPNVLVTQLPQRYLGIELKPECATPHAKEKAPDIESVSEEEARKIVEAHELKHQAAASAEGADAEQTATEAAVPAEEAPAAPSAEQSVSAAKAALEDPRLRQLLTDLRWLIGEGYVTEFGDGRLYASPVLKANAPRPASDEDEHDGDDTGDSEATAEGTESAKSGKAGTKTTKSAEAEAKAVAKGAAAEAAADTSTAAETTADEAETAPVAETAKPAEVVAKAAPETVAEANPTAEAVAAEPAAAETPVDAAEATEPAAAAEEPTADTAAAKDEVAPAAVEKGDA